MKRTSPTSLPRSRRDAGRTAGRTAGRLVTAIAISGSLALGPVIGMVSAQDAASTPAASPSAATPQAAGNVQITALMNATIDEMPSAPLTVRLLRITLQPGASVPMHTHPGPEFDRVESGTLTVSTKRTGQVYRGASGTPEALADDKATLKTGEWILYPAGTGMHFLNESDQPVNILSAVILPVGADAPDSITYTDGKPAENAFAGVSFTVLGDGLIGELPSGAAKVSIDELTVPEGSALPAAIGPVLYSRVSGDFAFRVDRGDVQVSRTASPGLQPSAIPDQEFTLGTGDAAFFQSGLDEMSRADAKGDLVVYRLAIEPATPIAGSPAAIQAIAPEPMATQAATPVAPAGGTPVATAVAGTWTTGTIVHTTTDGVNMRAEPSTNGEIVNQLNANTELEVVEGPQDADGETWYQVRLTDGTEGDTSIGWIAKSLLEAQNATPTPTATATAASGTPAAGTPVASPVAGTFKANDIVNVTEDRVRIRTAATTDSDAIDVIPVDQDLRIISGPEQADGITWYQVEFVGQEDVSGWVAGQFLKLAPKEDQGQ